MEANLLLRDAEEAGPQAVSEEAVDTLAAHESTPGVASEAGVPQPVPEPRSEAPQTTAPDPECEWLSQVKLLHLRLDEQERLSKDRERIIDRLHEENQRLKQGELIKSLMPIYRDLMRLYDDLQKTASDYSSKDEVKVDPTVQDWRFFATAVTDLLYRYGVDVLEVEPGVPFDAKSQRAAGVKQTNDPERDKTVSRVLTPGFSYEGRVLRPAAIEVFRYAAPVAAQVMTAEAKGEGADVG